MYNLFVSADEEAWDGKPLIIELNRCIREYTAPEITERFGEFDATSISELKRLPCIFAYETHHNKAPKFGVIQMVESRHEQVRVDYHIKNIAPFLSAEDLSTYSFEFDIAKWELHRTHWAVKNIDLLKELKSIGINLPPGAHVFSKVVDITTHTLDVALSFPGEIRTVVEQVALELEARIGSNSCFYDNNYASQLTRPSLNSLLHDIYRNRSKLVVVFLSGEYQKSDWCGIEFRAIQEIIMNRDHKKIMYVRMDSTFVDGVLKTDGYIDASKFSPQEIANFICERVELLS